MNNLNGLLKCAQIWDELGFKPNTKSFENRIVMQKTIFLLEQMGVKTGYEFKLTIRGPYSRELMEDIFELYGKPIKEAKP